MFIGATKEYPERENLRKGAEIIPGICSYFDKARGHILPIRTSEFLEQSGLTVLPEEIVVNAGGDVISYVINGEEIKFSYKPGALFSFGNV